MSHSQAHRWIASWMIILSGILFSTPTPASTSDTVNITQAGVLNIDYSLALKLPVFSPATTYATLNQAISNQSQQMQDTFFGNAAQNTLSATGEHPPLKNSLTATFDTTRNDHIKSTVIHFEAYNSPAAHPSHQQFTVTYDADTQSFVSLDDLFKRSNYLKKLSQLAQQKLNDQKIPSSDVLTQGTLPTADNFHDWTLTNKGLILYFSEYQVGAYVLGQPTVFISAAELRRQLSRYGKRLFD